MKHPDILFGWKKKSAKLNHRISALKRSRVQQGFEKQSA